MVKEKLKILMRMKFQAAGVWFVFVLFLTAWQLKLNWIMLPETWHYCHIHIAFIKCRDVINDRKCGLFIIIIIIIIIFKTVTDYNWYLWSVKLSYLNLKLYSILESSYVSQWTTWIDPATVIPCTLMLILIARTRYPARSIASFSTVLNVHPPLSAASLLLH